MKDKSKSLLDKFFSGQLSEIEKGEFTDIAGKDKDFVKSFIRDIELHSTIDDLYINKTDSIKNVNKKYFGTFFKKYIVYISLTAAIVCLALVFTFVKPTPKTKPPDLFDLYYSSYEPFITRGNDNESIPDSILFPYLEKDYNKLYSYLGDKSIYLNTGDFSKILLGVACIEVLDYNKAKEVFEMIDQDSPKSAVACWYLALLHLRSKDYIKAEEYLKFTAYESLMFGHKAELLIDTIKILKKGP